MAIGSSITGRRWRSPRDRAGVSLTGMTTAAKPKAGLEDTVATSSAICYLDGDRGVLAYCGYDIHDLARHATFEEVCYPAVAPPAADARRARRSAVAAGGRRGRCPSRSSG